MRRCDDLLEALLLVRSDMRKQYDDSRITFGLDVVRMKQ